LQRQRPMKSFRQALGMTCALFGLLALLRCGGSQETLGVPNAQPHTLEPGPQCLSRGATCNYDSDCCSEWCPNNVCAIRQP
jgi:hypothetical protein